LYSLFWCMVTNASVQTRGAGIWRLLESGCKPATITSPRVWAVYNFAPSFKPRTYIYL
jgi:hypothetical protein